MNKVQKQHLFEIEIFCNITNDFTATFDFEYTVGTESIQTPLNFSLFVILQPFAKII